MKETGLLNLHSIAVSCQRTVRGLLTILILYTLILSVGCSIKRNPPGVVGVLVLEDDGVLLEVSTNVGYRVAGPWVDELARLEGAHVRLRGRPVGDSVRAAEYELLGVGDGLVPIVGVLERSGLRVLIAGEAYGAYQLYGSNSDELLNWVGRRVWITGPIDVRRRIHVVHWGLLEAPD